jgi:hypothetical protein
LLLVVLAERAAVKLNVDCRFDLILIVESTIIFRNTCRIVERFFASKTCRLKTTWCENCRFVDQKVAMETVKTGYFI